MPMNNKELIATSGAVAVLVSTLISWAVWLFGTGAKSAKKYSTLESRVSGVEKDVKRIKAEDIAQLHMSINKLYNCFVTKDGNPRLMSFSEHDRIQAACQKRMDDRTSGINAHLKTHDQKLDKVLEGLAELRSTVKGLQQK